MADQPERKYKIMVVDDDDDIRTTITLALKDMGLTVVTASDGLAAITLAEAEHPDMVVLDLMLPNRGGFQVLQRLKGNRTMKGKRPLVCMMTGNTGTRHKEFAEQGGVDEYRRKPFAIGRLTEIIDAFLVKLKAGIEDAK
jgi:two-component system OmpR family response regulator